MGQHRAGVLGLAAIEKLALGETLGTVALHKALAALKRYQPVSFFDSNRRAWFKSGQSAETLKNRVGGFQLVAIVTILLHVFSRVSRVKACDTGRCAGEVFQFGTVPSASVPRWARALAHVSASRGL